MSGFFSGASQTSARGNSSRFNAGIYPAVRIERLSVKQGHNGLRFIMEATPVLPASERTPGVAPTPVGAEGSWTTQIDGQWGKIGMGETKLVIGLLCGMTPEEIDADPEIESKMEAAVAADNPHKGKLLRTEAWEHKTRNSTMTKHSWAPVDPADLARAQGASASVASPTPAASAASAPAAPAAPAAPPAAPPAIPDGFFAFPAGDPRHGTHVYNAAGEIRPID